MNRLTDAEIDALGALYEAVAPGVLESDLDCFDHDEPEIESCVADEGIKVLLTAGTGFFNRDDVPESERLEQWRLARETRAHKIAVLLAAISNTAPALLAEVREARRREALLVAWGETLLRFRTEGWAVGQDEEDARLTLGAEAVALAERKRAEKEN